MVGNCCMDDVLISYFFLIFRSLRAVRPDNFLAPVDVGARPAWRLKMRLGDEASPPSLLLSISPPLGHEGHSNLLWIRRDINATSLSFDVPSFRILHSVFRTTAQAAGN